MTYNPPKTSSPNAGQVSDHVVRAAVVPCARKCGAICANQLVLYSTLTCVYVYMCVCACTPTADEVTSQIRQMLAQERASGVTEEEQKEAAEQRVQSAALELLRQQQEAHHHTVDGVTVFADLIRPDTELEESEEEIRMLFDKIDKGMCVRACVWVQLSYWLVVCRMLIHCAVAIFSRVQLTNLIFR